MIEFQNSMGPGQGHFQLKLTIQWCKPCFKVTSLVIHVKKSIKGIHYLKIVSEYDQEIPQSQTADKPMASRVRATQPSRDTRKTN